MEPTTFDEETLTLPDFQAHASVISKWANILTMEVRDAIDRTATILSEAELKVNEMRQSLQRRHHD